ncbi:MAG: sulfite exporter TauE/SafE family protein [Actinobacteria bacterium]|nr:MAG: sulfite exporter TauE/SafE family protein [Actinomycetota bacterium]
MSLAAALVGLLSGVLSGAFGIGGGIVTTPAVLALGFPQLVAVGTPLPVIIPTALTGAWSYARRGLADLRAGVVIGAFGAAVSVVGALGAERVGGGVVLVVTAALIVYTAADMAVAESRGPRRASGALGEAAAVPRPAFAALAALGVVTGLYSGFLGLGGGFIIVPALARWLGYPIKRAIGTSLVAVCLIAVPGTATHWALGNVDWGLAAALVVGVVPGALVGAKLTSVAADRAVRLGFAALLAATGAWLAYAVASAA